eukprot:3661937-Prorocentrum_lima.AAC.1
MASDRSHPRRGKRNPTVTNKFPEGTGNHYVVQSAGEALANEGAALAKIEERAEPKAMWGSV